MRAVAVVGLVVVIALSVQPAASQVPDDKLIVPGQRIGKWTLEMTINDLLKMNGPRFGFPPNLSIGRSSLTDVVSPIYEHHWGRLTCFYALTNRSDSQKVIALGIGYPNSPTHACEGVDAYRTAKGPLYSPDALQAAYGKPTAITEAVPARGRWTAIKTIIFDQIGLGVHVVSGTNITIGFLVFRPGTAKSIWKYETGATQ